LHSIQRQQTSIILGSFPYLSISAKERNYIIVTWAYVSTGGQYNKAGFRVKRGQK